MKLFRKATKTGRKPQFAQWIYGRLIGGELRVVDLQSFSDTKRVGGFDFI